MKYPLYEKAKELLYSEYQKNFEIVKDSDYHRGYMDEKIKHSLQVSGAGNGILRNEAYFQNRTPEFVEIAGTAILLHDIFRFREIKILYETGQKLDHGIKGAEMLKSMPDFNNILITLPIKHHGHMIEELYADEEYKAIGDEQIKEDVKHIAFAVRDADKIANWQFLMTDFESIKQFWLKNTERNSNGQLNFTPQVWDCFSKQEVINNKLVKTNADKMLSVLCWLFDINYEASIKYSLKLNLFAKFYNCMIKEGINPQEVSAIKAVTEDYLQKHFKTM